MIWPFIPCKVLGCILQVRALYCLFLFSPVLSLMALNKKALSAKTQKHKNSLKGKESLTIINPLALHGQISCPLLSISTQKATFDTFYEPPCPMHLNLISLPVVQAGKGATPATAVKSATAGTPASGSGFKTPASAGPMSAADKRRLKAKLDGPSPLPADVDVGGGCLWTPSSSGYSFMVVHAFHLREWEGRQWWRWRWRARARVGGCRTGFTYQNIVATCSCMQLQLPSVVIRVAAGRYLSMLQ